MVGKSTLRFDWLAASCEEVPHRLGAGVTLWRVDLPEDVAVPTCLVGTQERERAARLRDPVERLRFTASYAVLRSVLSALGGGPDSRIEFVRDERGKPRVPGNGLRFSLSRSDGVVLIGVSESRDIGVDVERAREVPHVEALARNHLSPAEYEVWRHGGAAAKSLRFLRGWTRKEACVKAAGIGLAVPLAHVDVSCEASEIPREVVLQHRSALWTARVVSLPTRQRCIAAAAMVE
jgi:4'-phosphopantetheinyl transferase